MGRTILHDTMGFLADFDPFGKQEFTWTSFRFYLDCIAFEQRAETLRHVAAAVALDRHHRRAVISDERQINLAPDCIEHAAVHGVEAVGLESFLGRGVLGPSFPCANHRDHAVRDAVLSRECCHDAAPFFRVSDRFHNCGSQIGLALTLAHRFNSS